MGKRLVSGIVWHRLYTSASFLTMTKIAAETFTPVISADSCHHCSHIATWFASYGQSDFNADT
jgi:hypothetical protein